MYIEAKTRLGEAMEPYIKSVGSIKIHIDNIDSIYVDNHLGLEFWVSVKTEGMNYLTYRVSRVFDKFQHAEFQRHIIENKILSYKHSKEKSDEIRDVYK